MFIDATADPSKKQQTVEIAKVGLQVKKYIICLFKRHIKQP
jgi:hypothetical protein